MARILSDGVEGQPGAAPESTLASGISIGAVSSTVQSGHGARFPATGDFSIRFEDATDPTHFEIVTATARSTDALTHAATTFAWDSGDKVIHVISKEDFAAIESSLAGKQALSEKGAASGYAGLGADAKVADGQGRVQDLLDWQFVRKTADESVTSSTVLQDDDVLTLAIGANEIWQFVLDAVVFSDNPAGAGHIKCTMTAPAGASGYWHTNAQFFSGGTLTTVGTSNVFGASKDFYTDSALRPIPLRGLLVNGATPGSLTFQWAQNSSNATATTIKAHSCLMARRVA